jgi:alkylated DNA nucleotide flippase Atl1
VSPRSSSDSHELQQMLLEEEGVVFSLDGKVSLTKFCWKPKC